MKVNKFEGNLYLLIKIEKYLLKKLINLLFYPIITYILNKSIKDLVN